MWNWLKKLWNGAKNLVAKIFQAFIEWIIYLIEVVYITFITSIILTFFTAAYVTYVMLYVLNGEAVLEIWDPEKKQQPSKIITLEKPPSGVVKPNREEAEVLKATRK
ncbi:MAG: hypothetical protein AAGJ08_18865 [Cyanobacteria bacterium P01_H01_bin.35]